MSFFNLTKLGIQDPVNHAVNKPATSQEVGAVTVNRTTLSEPVYPNSEANGSYVKYTERRTKHIRNDKGPNEIYDHKLTQNVEYGWWMKDGVQHQPWTKNERRPMIQSAMTKGTPVRIGVEGATPVTRFVDDMTLTNREFTLF